MTMGERRRHQGAASQEMKVRMQEQRRQPPEDRLPCKYYIWYTDDHMTAAASDSMKVLVLKTSLSPHAIREAIRTGKPVEQSRFAQHREMRVTKDAPPPRRVFGPQREVVELIG